MRPHSANSRMPPGGFTLIELLVAMLITAVLAFFGYAGLRNLLRAEGQLTPAYEDASRLRYAVYVLSEDVRNVAPRSARDALGASRPALQAGLDGVVLELSRNAISVAGASPLPDLRRVSYRLVDGELYRDVWPVLDLTQASAPTSRRLLVGVANLAVRFLPPGASGVDSDWIDYWPKDPGSELADQLPRGVHVELRFQDGGSINRWLIPPST